MDHRTWYCFKYCTRRVLCTKECEEPGRTVWNSEFSKCHLLVGRFRECADHVRASLASCVDVTLIRVVTMTVASVESPRRQSDTIDLQPNMQCEFDSPNKV